MLRLLLKATQLQNGKVSKSVHLTPKPMDFRNKTSEHRQGSKYVTWSLGSQTSDILSDSYMRWANMTQTKKHSDNSNKTHQPLVHLLESGLEQWKHTCRHY